MHQLLHKKVLLLDGGLGTTLEDFYNVKFTQETPLWSSHLLISDPQTLYKVQKEFSDAGADITLTPTYQASHAGFRKTKDGVSDLEIQQYLQDAVQISRSVDSGLVALSLGAYGAVLQPSQEYSGEYGNITKSGLLEFHHERMSAVDLSSIDLIAFETLPRLDEIQAVKEAVDGSTPYWISCVFPKDNKLPDGSTIEAVVSAMIDGTRPWAIGMNCTKVNKVMALIIEFEESARKLNITLPRLVLYPDGTNGQIYDTTKQMWIGKENEDGPWHQKMFEIVEEVLSRGNWEGIVVGGCCKTSPQNIKALSQLLSAAGI
ncbi:hypothetical protein R6Q59_010090 [Mikania micrantha]